MMSVWLQRLRSREHKEIAAPKRYWRWCIRHASYANCNPVLGILAVLVVVGTGCHIYRETIIDDG